MKKSQVIEFEPKERILEKAKKYVDSAERFLEERETAVPLLLKALKYAERDLKLKIMLLLTSFAKQEVAWPLYEILRDPSEQEEVRNNAAIQLSVIAPFLKDPEPLLDNLLRDLESPDPELRLHATFALGWEGNARAAIPLVDRLYDTDSRVQQSAVNALCNLRDERILNLLLERLEHGPLEQKRTILFNLWRFYTKQEEVTTVYLKYLDHEDAEIRLDALILLGQVTEVSKHIEVYRKCLKDENPRVRELALRRLGEEGGENVSGLLQEIKALVDDPHMEVKRAALEALKRISGAS